MDIYKIIVSILLVILIVGCKQISKQVDNKKMEKNITKENMDKNYISEEKAWLDDVLKDLSMTLTDINASPKAEDLKATYAKGFMVKEHPIKAMAYLYEHQNEHHTALNYIKALNKNDVYHAVYASNGRWLLWVYSEQEDANNIYIINNLVAKFSGEE